MTKKEKNIQQFQLVSLVPEGGFIHELYRGSLINGRPSYSTILYQITEDGFSHMHRLAEDEIWFYHDGSSVEMLLIYEDHSEIRLLGKDCERGECPQVLVPGGVWQGAHMKTPGEYALVSTVVVPSYDEKHFTLGSYDELRNRTEYQALLRKLTGLSES